MNSRPASHQYERDGLYAFVAATGTAFAHVEWQPADDRFIISDPATRRPLGWVSPATFNQRVIGYVLQ